MLLTRLKRLKIRFRPFALVHDDQCSPWDNLKFDPEGIEEVRRKFWYALQYLFVFCALCQCGRFEGTENEVPVSERPEIDRWILSLLNTLIKEVTEHYDNYEPTRADVLFRILWAKI